MNETDTERILSTAQLLRQPLEIDLPQIERPVRYMRGWELQRVVKLAERWHWKLTLSDDERAQLEQQ